MKKTIKHTKTCLKLLNLNQRRIITIISSQNIKTTLKKLGR